jgi:rod shape-determining protein MreC
MSRRRQLVAGLVLLALVLITLDFREDSGPVGALQRGADTVFAPIQGGFAAVVRPIGGFLGSITELGSLRSVIAQLQADNQELLAESRVTADLERRLREAEALLNMSREQDITLVGARVIASPPGTFERSIVIDVGATQGVVAEMAVVNTRGVVGYVVEVTATRARVNLLSSTETGLGVRVAQTGAVGLLQGQGSGLLRLEMLASNPDVPLDAVITTQSFQGSLVPGGLPVGVLVPPADGDLLGERFLEVRPYVDFGSLSSVAVVVAGRETDGDFSPEETIRTDGLAPAPTVTREPDPAAAARPSAATPTPTDGEGP